MDQRMRAALAAGAVGVIFLLVQGGALALVEPFRQSGLQPVENPQDVGNSVLYVLLLLVATGGMLAAIRYDLEWLIRALVVFTGGYIALLMLWSVSPAGTPTLAGIPVLALGGAGALVVGLLAYPEWYVIDAAGVVMGAGAAGLFGISFGVLPALVLLSVLAVYDAISVYGTEHMLTLASGVMDLNIPVVLVVPMTLSYSFLDADLPDQTDEDEESVTDDENNTGDADEEGIDPLDREALFIGLGDAVIPTVLVASAAFFAPGDPALLAVPFLTLTVPAAAAMLGTFAGLAVLLWLVLKGRAHAGLPLLNGGAITGYLLGAVAAGVPLSTAVGI